MRKQILVSLMCCLVTAQTWSQVQEGEETLPVLTEQIQENYLNQNQETETIPDISYLTDDRHFQLSHAIDLNRAETADLEKLGFLSDRQIEQIIQYRVKNNRFISLYELGYVEGLDSSVIQRLLPYVKVGKQTDPKGFKFRKPGSGGFGYFLYRYSQVLDPQKGYTLAGDSGGYLGDPQAYHFRLLLTPCDRISFGLSGSKDPGERFFRGDQKQGFDSYAGFLMIEPPGVVKRVIIGNYRVQTGQGLNLGTGSLFFNPQDPLTYRKTGSHLHPSMSTNPAYSFNGVAAQGRYGWIEMTSFFSYRKRDINGALEDSTGHLLTFSSFDDSDDHRTESEIASRRKVREIVYGGNLRFRADWFNIGGTCTRMSMSLPITPEDEMYKTFAFRGPTQTNYGMDISAIWKSLVFYGEVSHSHHGSTAWLAGLNIQPDADLVCSILFRNYPPAYHNLFGSAYGAQQTNNNESGFLTGVRWRVHQTVILSASCDVYHHPSLKYRTHGSSSGRVMTCEGIFGRPDHQFLVRYRFLESEINESSETPRINYPIKQQRQQIRFHFSYTVLPGIIFKDRLDIRINRKSGDNRHYGYLLYHDIQYRPETFPFMLATRFALFDTDTWDERMYAYENDLLFAFSVPALYDKGIRCYLLCKVTCFRRLDLWLKYARTWYTDKKSVGSGLDESEGNVRSTVAVQMRFRF